MRTRTITALALTLALCAALTSGCASATKSAGDTSKSDSPTTSQPASPQTIDAKEAKRMMDSGEPFTLVDVRTAEEYQAQHIDGALLIPVDVIASEAAAKLPDKGATILIYCRSGNRSATAARALAGLGYTKVYDFGGIINWPYETVSGSN